MKLIATVLAAFSAAAAVEGEETRRLGSKAAGKAKAGKGGSYSCSVSTKSGKGSKGSSKGGKGSSFSYYSMSYPSSCAELDSMFQPVYMLVSILRFGWKNWMNLSYPMVAFPKNVHDGLHVTMATQKSHLRP